MGKREQLQAALLERRRQDPFGGLLQGAERRTDEELRREASLAVAAADEGAPETKNGGEGFGPRIRSGQTERLAEPESAKPSQGSTATVPAPTTALLALAQWPALADAVTSGLRPRDFKLLSYFVRESYGRGRDTCRIPFDKIRTDCGWSKLTARRAIASLRGKGFLRVIHNTYHTPNDYQVLLPPADNWGNVSSRGATSVRMSDNRDDSRVA